MTECLTQRMIAAPPSPPLALCPHFATAIDASGGVPPRVISQFKDGLASYCARYENFTLDAWFFDMWISAPRRFTSETIADLRDHTAPCGGGTSSMANFEYMQKFKLRPDRLVIFTDGMFHDGWGQPDYCDTIFVIHSTKLVAPYGRTIHFDAFVEGNLLEAE